MKKTLLNFAPLSISQLIFTFTSELFIYLIPDFSDSAPIGIDDIWMRFYLEGLFVLPLSLYLVLRLKLKVTQGFILSNLLAGFSLMAAGLGMYKGNYSPLLYCLIYRVLNESCWIFSTTFAISMMLKDDIKKLCTILAFFQVFFIIGSIFAPFIGYLIYTFSLPVIFLVLSLIQIFYSLRFLISFSKKPSYTVPNIDLSRYISRPNFKSSLFLQFASQTSASFLSFTLLPSLQKDLNLSELTIHSLLLTFKVSFLISSLFFPAISKLHSNSSNLLLYGYILSIPSYALLSAYISSHNILLKSISLTLLGFSSVWVLIPPVLRSFQSIKHLYASGPDNDLTFQVVFISILVSYFGQYIGLLIGGAVKSISCYSISSLVWSLVFSILSITYCKFLDLSQSNLEKLETKHIEMIDINWEDSSH